MMKKILIIAACLFSITFVKVDTVLAIYDPRSLPNNVFGIHIVDSNDIPAAAALVNSAHNGSGDWGYVTLVISQNDRNVEKWNTIFKDLGSRHLIPIVRLATIAENSMWVAAKEEETSGWVDFLDSLSWPIQNRYVILFNEPNHRKEWGGVVDPKQYATIVDRFISSLKQKNHDFFILPAGLDLYAPNGFQTMEATSFWAGMEESVPGILNKFDGWTSHSYPSHDYSGSAYESGRYSINGYKWELEYISNQFGVSSNLPVFITETGWAQNPHLSRETIAQNYKIAFDEIWSQDASVVAVTPFLLNYQDGLFAKFSWKKLNSEEFYPQYHIIRDLAKVLGEPLRVPLSKFGMLLHNEQAKKSSRYQAMLP